MPEKLRSRRDFLRAQERGRRFRRGHLLLLVHPTSEKRTRVGYTISRKVGGAVVRNRVRRRLRELIRAAADDLSPDCDFVIIAHPSAAAAEFDELRGDLTWLLSQAKRWVDSTKASLTSPSS